MDGIWLNRRANFDRRRKAYHIDDSRYGSDRRKQAYNDYVLIVGGRGLDAISLFVVLPIVLMLGAALVGSF